MDRNSLAVVRGEEAWGNWMKNGGRISRRTHIHTPWTQTAVVMARGKGLQGGWRGAKWGEMGTSAIVSTIKIKTNKRLWINS